MADPQDNRTARWVLLVDDDPLLSQLMVDVLDYAGIGAEVARHGAEAVDILRRGGPLPILVLSDIMMPVMDGYALRERLLHQPTWAAIPFAFVSALDPVQAMRDHANLAIDAFLPKPFSMRELLALVRGASMLDAQRAMLSRPAGFESVACGL